MRNMWYCVVDIKSGELVELSQSVAKIAAAMEPGTVFCQSMSRVLALDYTRETAKAYREGGYKPLEIRHDRRTDGIAQGDA